MYGVPYYGRGDFVFLIPVLLLTLVVVLVFFLRWFNHRERMAMIEKGLSAYPSHPGLVQDPTMLAKRSLARGLTTAFVGLAITLGLLTIGVGPWLLLGLIPLFIGLAMILSHLIMLPESPKRQEPKQKPQPEQPMPQQKYNVEPEEQEEEQTEEMDKEQQF